MVCLLWARSFLKSSRGSLQTCGAGEFLISSAHLLCNFRLYFITSCGKFTDHFGAGQLLRFFWALDLRFFPGLWKRGWSTLYTRQILKAVWMACLRKARGLGAWPCWLAQCSAG